jgi:hypothetical protein
LAGIYRKPGASAGFLKKSFKDEKDDPQQENDDRDLVYSMHHPDIDVVRSGGVFLPEKITTHFTKGKKLLQSPLLLLIGLRFHT